MHLDYVWEILGRNFRFSLKFISEDDFMKEVSQNFASNIKQI